MPARRGNVGMERDLAPEPVWSSARAPRQQQRAAKAAHDGARRLPHPRHEARPVGETMPRLGGPKRHDQVDAGVERHRDQPEHDELRGDNPCRIDELRDEGEEERRRLRVQRLDDDALAKRAPAAGRRYFGRFCAPGLTPGLDAEPDEIESTGDLQHRERLGARHHQRGEANRTGDHVDQAAETEASARRQLFRTAAGQRPRRDVENAGAWRQRDHKGGGEIQEESAEFGHGAFFAGRWPRLVGQSARRSKAASGATCSPAARSRRR